MNKIKNNKILFVLFATFFIGLGAALAYFIPSIIGESYTVMGTSKVTKPDITFINADNNIEVLNKYPMTEKVAIKTIQDQYSFSIKNNGDKSVRVQIIIEANNNNTITNDSLIDTKINNNSKVRLNTPIEATTDGYTNGYILLTDVINNDETKNYDLKIWINEKGNNLEDDNNNIENLTWSGRIIVKAVINN